jgi:hypothetical protein
MSDRKTLRRPDRPETYRRDKAVSREITPCSEYTRYTAEGRFRDPYSDESVILDSEGMAILFGLGPFKKPRWSKRLGYGMAIIGEDTRVHLHANGKFVIRRALDKSHAENILKTLSTISKPNIYSTRHERYLWEILRDISFGAENGGMVDIFGWEEEVDQVMEEAIRTFQEIDEEIGERIDDPDDMVLIDQIHYKGAPLENELKKELNKVLEGNRYQPGKILGISSYIILASMAIPNG